MYTSLCDSPAVKTFSDSRCQGKPLCSFLWDSNSDSRFLKLRSPYMLKTWNSNPKPKIRLRCWDSFRDCMLNSACREILENFLQRLMNVWWNYLDLIPVTAGLRKAAHHFAIKMGGSDSGKDPGICGRSWLWLRTLDHCLAMRAAVKASFAWK